MLNTNLSLSRERLSEEIMSLDKAILHHKEHRKPYRGAKAVDRTCRNHGSCEYCKGNRLHKFKKDEPIEENP